MSGLHFVNRTEQKSTDTLGLQDDTISNYINDVFQKVGQLL